MNIATIGCFNPNSTSERSKVPNLSGQRVKSGALEGEAGKTE